MPLMLITVNNDIFTEVLYNFDGFISGLMYPDYLE